MLVVWYLVFMVGKAVAPWGLLAAGLRVFLNVFLVGRV
jgi:hypothetical protein